MLLEKVHLQRIHFHEFSLIYPCIDFLTSQNAFAKGKFYSQFGLNLDTGDGKTFCMIYAISVLQVKSIIITHKTRIKEQWQQEFLSKSNIQPESIVMINGSPDMDKIMKRRLSGDIYIVNHPTLTAYANEHGWDQLREFFKRIRVGVKVIDEAHKFFHNMLMIDFNSNVARSFYLTATFSRSDPTRKRCG